MKNFILAGNFDNVGKILESFLNQWWGPLLGVLGAAAFVLAVSAGVKYILAAHSGDEQKLKQAKQYIVGIVIGIIVVFLMAGLIPVLISAFQSWYDDSAQQFTALISSMI